jgi:phosphoenolpyruvate synthase/pyruvate phosphate dikinase
MDIRLEFEGKLDKKDELIRELMETIVKLKDDIKGKDQAIRALSDTLLEKGLENQKLSEAVNEIKNHLLATTILG